MKLETLKTHLRRIKDKYAAAGRLAHTRLELYRRALEDGFVLGSAAVGRSGDASSTVELLVCLFGR